MARPVRTIDEMTLWDDAKEMLKKAKSEGIETAWDRLAQQTPHCTFCETGTTCRNCTMGPYRISAKADGRMQRGVCGVDADVIVARNFVRFVAGGSAGHSNMAVILSRFSRPSSRAKPPTMPSAMPTNSLLWPPRCRLLRRTGR